MKMGSCEGTKQLQQDFIKDDAAGDAAEMAASPFLLFSRKVRFCKKCEKNAGKHLPGNGRK